MPLMSPFEGLQMPAELACEFFATFSRFEFALKEEGYVRIRYGRASPDWKRFAREIGVVPLDLTAWRGDIDLLLAAPPEVQTDAQRWEATPLDQAPALAQAIEAAQRVRNNLFHGGKHSPQPVKGRDEALVRAALHVLHACLDAKPSLRDTYNQHEF